MRLLRKNVSTFPEGLLQSTVRFSFCQGDNQGCRKPSGVEVQKLSELPSDYGRVKFGFCQGNFVETLTTTTFPGGYKYQLFYKKEDIKGKFIEIIDHVWLSFLAKAPFCQLLRRKLSKKILTQKKYARRRRKNLQFLSGLDITG